MKSELKKLNDNYKELIKGVINKFGELGITLNKPDTYMNPLKLSLIALEKDYIKEIKSLINNK